jgi:hypothetical protein
LVAPRFSTALSPEVIVAPFKAALVNAYVLRP